MSDYCMKCMYAMAKAGQCPHCGYTGELKDVPHQLQPGTMLSRRYLVGNSIGQGGFGITYIGLDMKLGMRVAIKEFFPTGYANRNHGVSSEITISSEKEETFFVDGREKFYKEARAVAKFSGHPGIVDVRDFFEENNTAYIVMEYLEGQNLRDYMQEHGLFSPDEIFALLDPVFEALQKIHEEGIVHRDISPDNIMFLSGGNVKLMDFGAARAVNFSDQRSLSIILKAGYAPEEQYRSKGEQGPWTDIYALCATIYRCITGIVPDDALQRLYADYLKRPSELGIVMDAKMENALMAGLQVKAKDRCRSMAEFRAILGGKQPEQSRVEAPKTVLLEEQREHVLPREMASDDNRSANGSGIQTRKRKPGIALILGGLAFVAVLVIGLIILLGNSNDSKNTGQSSAPTEAMTSTPTPEPVAAVSDKLDDFMFELEGEVYQLPVLYKAFAEKGWHPDGKVTEEDELGGYSYLYCYLTNDIVRISAEIINMSGHVRKLKECTIGSIEIEVSNNLDFSIAKGIRGTATRDEIIEAFGLPSSNNNYETSEYVTYDFGYRKKVKFYLDYEKSYNSYITLQCYETTEHDVTVVSEETPEYLAEYVKPKKVGSDVKETLFMLDGKRYRLPCPLSEFINDGWEILQADIKSLGAWNYSSVYDVKLTKGDVKIDVGLLNCSDKEVYIKDCAVHTISFETYQMKNIEEGYVKLPKGLTMSSTVEDIAKVCTDFSENKQETYASYTYQDSGNTIKVYYYVDKSGNKTIQLKNLNWEYK